MEFRSWKTAAVAGLAAVTLGGAVLGVVSAEPGTPGSGTGPWQHQGGPGQQSGQWQQHRDQYLTALAGKLNVTVDQLKQAMEQARTQVGVNGPQGGQPGMGEHRGMGERGMGLDAVAQALNITRDQLWKELPGKTLTDVARAHSVDPATLAAKLKAAANTRIDQMTAGKNLPADQIAQMKQGAAQRIDAMMTRVFPAGGFTHGQGQ